MMNILEKEEERILKNLEVLLARSNETVERVEKTKSELDNVTERVREAVKKENETLLHLSNLKTELSTIQNLLEQRKNELALYKDLSAENTALKAENDRIQSETRNLLRDISLIKLQYQAHLQEMTAAKLSYEENQLVYRELEDKLILAREEEKKTNGYYIGQLQALLDKNHIKFDVIKHLQ